MSDNRKLNQIFLNAPQFDMWKQSIIIAYRGSIAHGTYVPNSNPGSIDDKDILGIAIPNKEYTFGLKTFEQFERFEGVWDVLIYDFKKAIRLLKKVNPNILQLLWTPEKHILKMDPCFQELIDIRHAFLSRDAVFNTFAGYANGQLHKMENQAYRGYMGEKRKGLVDKYGFDTKNAQHLIRILRQGKELLVDGVLNVERKDSGELIQIKKGEWSLEKVKREARNLFNEIREAKEHSVLPLKRDDELIELTTINILSNYWGIKNA